MLFLVQLNGWDTDVLTAMLADPSCKAGNTNNGNSPQNCVPLAPYVKPQVTDNCTLARSIPLTENIGLVGPIGRLPGCNPVTASNAVPCTQGAAPNATNNQGTFFIQSKTTGLYLTFNPVTERIFANGSTTDPTYRQIWGVGWAPRGLGQTVRNSEVNKEFTMQDTLKVKGTTPDTWEVFSFENQPTGGYVAIKNLRYGKYLKVESDFTISGQATVITDACLFQLVTPDGGYVPTGIQVSDLPALTATN